TELSKAKEQLEKIGLKMVISKQIHNDTFEKDAVISQEPEGGAKIEEHTPFIDYLAQVFSSVKL
ncbi:unnamed protein product, partial [marine sediment metagenome]